MRIRFWRWTRRASLGLAALLALLVAAGAISEQAARWNVWRNYPPPGRMVDIGGRRMQIDCRGQGTPTAVFESGAGPLGGLDWGKVQGPVAAFTRACTYSRAGELWSDPAGTKLTDKRVAEDLHATLAAAGEKPPFLLVGHSLGGPYVATYTGLYPDDVVGLVLVSPGYPDQYARFAAIVGPEKAGFPQLRMLRIANALDWTGLTRRLFATQAADPSLPPGVGATSLAWLFRTLPTLVDEYAQLPDLLLESGQYRTFGNRPVIVLSEGLSNVAHAADLSLTPDEAARADRAELGMRQEEASWSRRGQVRVVAGVEHFIQLQKPEAVIAAVREVVDETRAKQGS